MHPDWVHDFKAFAEWIIDNIGWRPPKKQIDRIDNNGNYAPGNLKWSTSRENGLNRETNATTPYVTVARRRKTHVSVIKIELKAFDDTSLADKFCIRFYEEFSADVERMISWAEDYQ